MLEDLRTAKLAILGLMRMDISAADGVDEVRIQRIRAVDGSSRWSTPSDHATIQ